MIHTVISTASSPWMTFPALSYDWLTGYSTDDKKGWRKTDHLPQQFGLLQGVKPISNRPVFQCSPLSFSQLLSPLFWFTKNVIVMIHDQVKSLNHSSECTKLSLTVILTASSPCTPHFRHCRTLYWLSTEPVQTRLTENRQFTASVWTPSQQKTTCKMNGVSVITS